MGREWGVGLDCRQKSPKNRLDSEHLKRDEWVKISRWLCMR